MDDRRIPSVLVVEDEPVVLMLASEMIEQAGWIALEATNSAEALEVLAQNPRVDLLFTDINMPGPMDGLELAACVRNLHPHMHLVVTSGKRIVADCLLPDGGTFLAKPYGCNQLIEVITAKLG